MGDFENLLFNKEKREVEISLPFTFLGVRDIYINLLFDVPVSKGAYIAHLRAIKVIDQADSTVLFSFMYREASEEEKRFAKVQFNQELENYTKRKNDPAEKNESSFSTSKFLFQPFENSLEGYVEWTMQLDKLKSYLVPLKEFYELYLNKRKTWKPLEEIDDIVHKSGIIPSLLIKSFKGDIPIDSWTDFIDKKLGEKTKISGKEYIGESDFEPDDYFFPVPQIEDILYSEALKILRNNLKWTGTGEDEMTYSIIENSFRSSWQVLVNRISTINYVSTIREENLRIYHVGDNSPFIKLLKDYSTVGYGNEFVKKHLKAFEIGKEIKIDYQPKYQLISVSIITLEGHNRELVDFGYGIKQLIVFLIQISVLAEKNKRVEHVYSDDGDYMEDIYDSSLLLIEEPESNLHPKWQSLLAEMFMEANKKFNIQLIIETHSEYLIRKFQTLVAKRELDGSDIKIFYLRNFSKLPADKKQVESITIQDDGSINYKMFDSGFFDESDELELSLLNIQRDRFRKDFEDLKQNQQENENKITELESKIDEYTSRLNITVYTQIIANRFETHKLAPLSLQYLVSGQFLLNTIHEHGDFSPVIIQYGRAIENEAKDKLFNCVNSTKRWMLGPMQGSLEKFKFGSTAQQTSCSSIELSRLTTELSNKFSYPTNLRIELLENIRTIRNYAGHSGQTKTKQDAENYILTVTNFLDVWIAEMR